MFVCHVCHVVQCAVKTEYFIDICSGFNQMLTCHGCPATQGVVNADYVDDKSIDKKQISTDEVANGVKSHHIILCIPFPACKCILDVVQEECITRNLVS